MAADFMYIGCSPAAEDCVQVGSEDYMGRARPECERFMRAIINFLGEPPEGAGLYIASNPHDFGTYLSVNARFEIGNEKATKYAYDCEGALPNTWAEIEKDPPSFRHDDDWDDEEEATQPESRVGSEEGE